MKQNKNANICEDHDHKGRGFLYPRKERNGKREQQSTVHPLKHQDQNGVFQRLWCKRAEKTAVITAIIGVLFYFFHYQRTENVVVLIVGIMVSAGVGVAIFSKDERNQSMMDTLGHMLRFARQQKKYPYRFYKEDWYV